MYEYAVMNVCIYLCCDVSCDVCMYVVCVYVYGCSMCVCISLCVSILVDGVYMICACVLSVGVSLCLILSIILCRVFITPLTTCSGVGSGAFFLLNAFEDSMMFYMTPTQVRAWFSSLHHQ
mgnify:CR=1 FL=1